MVKDQYLSGQAGTVAIKRTAVTVTAIPTVFIRCQSVACPSKERSLGISRNAHQHLQQHTAAASTVRSKL